MASVKKRKVNGSRWCEIEITLEPNDETGIPRLSITGSEGRVTTAPLARKDAISYWESYFDAEPGEIIEMGKRVGKRFSSARGAARFVVESDGEFHGLDIHKDIGEGSKRRILIMECGGQIPDTLREWFPEYADLLPYHLNDMKAGAPDQEAALASAPKDWWRALPGGKYGPDFYSHACMALALGGILYSKHEGPIVITGRGKRPACAYWDAECERHPGYRYGAGWVQVPLPEHVRARLKELFPDAVAA